jgi:hypothetical protein
MTNPTTITVGTFDLAVLPRRFQAILASFPLDTWLVLGELTQRAEAQTRTPMASFMRRNLQVMEDTGLIERKTFDHEIFFQLTLLGRTLASVQTARPALYADLIHSRFFTLYEEQRQAGMCESGWSWMYQATCRLLWEIRPQVPAFKTLAAALNQRIGQEYLDYNRGVHRVGPNAVQVWLRELDPPFLHLEGKSYRTAGRTWCTPELLALGVHWLYAREGLPYGSPLRLSDTTRAELATLCLMEMTQLDAVFDIAVATFPFLRAHSGEWGRAIILDRRLTIPDIL